MSFTYVQSERNLWTVGSYDPSGKWHPDSDYNDRNEAAERAAYLNGGGNAVQKSSVTMLSSTEEYMTSADILLQTMGLKDGPRNAADQIGIALVQATLAVASELKRHNDLIQSS